MNTGKRRYSSGGLNSVPVVRRWARRLSVVVLAALVGGLFTSVPSSAGAFSLRELGSVFDSASSSLDLLDSTDVVSEITDDGLGPIVSDVGSVVEEVVDPGDPTKLVELAPAASLTDDLIGDIADELSEFDDVAPDDLLDEIVENLNEVVPDPVELPDLGDIIDPDDLDPTGTVPVLLDELVGLLDELLPALQLGELQYDIRTAWGPAGSGCTEEQFTPAVVNVPTPVDVDTTPGPDVVVTLVAVPSLLDGGAVVRLDVRSLSPGNPDGVLVEAIVGPGNGDGRVAVGYDQCEGGVPDAFGAELVAIPSEGAIDVNITSSANTESLTVIAGAFQDDNGTRVNPTDVAIGFTPAPARVLATVRSAPDGFTAGFTSSRSLDVSATLNRTAGTAKTTVGADIRELPQTLSVTVGSGSVDYSASAPVPEVGVAYQSTDGGTVQASASATLQNVPRSVQVDRGTGQDGQDHLVISASTATGTRFAADVEVFDGVDVVQGSVGVDPVPAQVTVDLTDDAITYSAASPVDEVTAGFRKGGLNADVTLRDVPNEISISTEAGENADTIRWQSSSRLGEVELRLEDSSPIVGPAQEIYALLRGLPTRASVSISDDVVTLRSDGVDLIEFLAGSGPRLPDGSDGLRYVDDGNQFFVHGRLTGLEQVIVADLGITTFFTSDLAGERPFVLDAATSSTQITGQIADLPSRMSMSYRNLATDLLFYSASERSGAVTLDIREDDNLKRLTVPTGLPTDLEACVAPNGLSCLTGSIPSDYNRTSFRIDVDQPTRVQFYDCTPGPNSRPRVCDPSVVQPDSFADGVGHGRDFTWVDLTIDQRLELGFARESDFSLDASRLRLDTQFGAGAPAGTLTGPGIRGALRVGKGESNGNIDERIDFNIGLLRAQDRVLTLDCDFGCPVIQAERSGRILCQNVGLRVDTQTPLGYIDVKDLIC